MSGLDARMGDQYVRFKLGGKGFGLPLAQVREVAIVGRVSRVPLAPPAVRGITSWRGRVITLIDVATITGRPLPPAELPEERLALILTPPYGHLGVYIHAPVEIGVDAAPTQTMGVGTTVPGSSGKPVVSTPPAPGGGVEMLCARDLVLHCENEVLETVRERVTRPDRGSGPAPESAVAAEGW